MEQAACRPTTPLPVTMRAFRHKPRNSSRDEIANVNFRYDDIVKVKVKGAYSSLQAGLPSPLRELTFTYHMGSHSVTCHPAEVTFPPLPQPKLVLDLATPEGCKAELT